MFLVFLGFVYSDDLKDLCLIKAANTSCPKGITGETNATILLNSITGPTRIYTDYDSTIDIDPTKFMNVREVISFGKQGNATINVVISSAATHSGLALSNVTLNVSNAATNERRLLETNNLTFNSMILLEGATVNKTSTILIKKLNSSSFESAKNLIDLIKGDRSALILDGKDILCSVEPVSSKKGLKLSDCTKDSPLTIDTADDFIGIVTVNNVITKDTNFSVKGNFSACEKGATISIKGSGNRAIANLIGDSGYVNSATATIAIDVQTYYSRGENFSNVSALFTLTNGVECINGTRATIPESTVYYYDKDGNMPEEPKAGSQLLWSELEIAKVLNMTKDKIDIYFTGAPTLDSPITIEHVKVKSLGLFGTFNSNQSITFDINANGKVAFPTMRLINTKINAKIPSSSSASTIELSITSLTIKNTTFNSTKEASQTTSKLLSGNNVNTSIKTESLTTNAATFNDLGEAMSKPSKSFAIEDVKSAKFYGDGKTVTIDGVNFTEAIIPVPFAIQVPEGEESIKPTFEMTKNGNDAGKALPFEFNIEKGAKMTNLSFTGDWSANNIRVNVAEGSEFIAAKGSSNDDKSPSMDKVGNGKAFLDDVAIKEVPGAPTTKGGLSGGAIAGIVIACVVVVAAVVVVVVVVVKKKKSKVAN